MHKYLIDEIEFQISEIDRLFSEYKLFFENMNYESPDIVQITVIANILHSFYNGVEKIFERILKDIDNYIPTGNKTHQEILNHIYKENENRPNIINNDTYISLNEYLGFRHFFRHSYSFQFKWEKMKPLNDNLFKTWHELKEQLNKYLQYLK